MRRNGGIQVAGGFDEEIADTRAGEYGPVLRGGMFVPAHAAERVYLRSGSDVVCDHQKNIDGQIRLYLAPSEESYVDVSPADILHQEFIPAALEKASVELPQPATDEKAASPQAASAAVDLPVLLNQAGAKHHLDPDLLASVVRAESGGHAHVVSRAGARGLMQLMPGTAADLGVRDSFRRRKTSPGGPPTWMRC